MADDEKTRALLFDKRFDRIEETLTHQYFYDGLTFEQAKEVALNILDSFKTCGDYQTEEVGYSLATIALLPDVYIAVASEPTQDEWHQYISEMAKFWADCNYLECIVTAACALKDDIVSKNFNEDTQSVFNIYALCRGLWSYSDTSTRIADDFGKMRGVGLLMDIIKILDCNINQDHSSISKERGYQNKIHLVISIMGILHNCTRHNDRNRHVYRKANAVGFFEAKTNSRCLNVRIAAVLILAHIGDDKSTERVAPKLDCVLLLVELLRRAVVSERHLHLLGIIGEYDDSSCYFAQELTNALCKLAVNDVNKLAIQKCGGIPILIDMLQDDFSDEEAVEALRLLWILVSMETIKRDDDILDMMEDFQNLTTYQPYSTREAATYILWEMRNHDMDFSSLPEDPSLAGPQFYLATSATEDEKPTSGCIVISYQFDSGPKALYIRDKLESSGYNVWMSEFPLKERSLEQKVGIISQSSIMLVCITENYKHEPSCRADVSYAKEQRKTIIPLLMDSEYRPDGWIDKLLGTDAKYHRFCTNEDMDRNLHGVMEELGDNGKTRSGKAIGHKLKSMMKMLRTALDTSKSSNDTFLEACERNSRYWSSQRVQSWLRDNGLEQVALPPELCQGNQLMHMYEHCTKTMHTFTEQLKSDCELDDTTVIKFTAALCKLFR